MEAGKFSVYLVLRGDTNLDGRVGVQDAQLALVYYTETKVSQKDASELLNDANCIYLNDQGEQQIPIFPYSHYAMDVDGNGEITVEDAQNILKYYTEINVSGNDDVTWDHAKIIGEKKIPREDLHAEPLGRDSYAAEYVGLRKKLAEQGN